MKLLGNLNNCVTVRDISIEYFVNLFSTPCEICNIIEQVLKPRLEMSSIFLVEDMLPLGDINDVVRSTQYLICMLLQKKHKIN